MSIKTKEPPADTVETIGEEIVKLGKKIADMEAELQEGTGTLSWEEVTASTADELARKEQRRSVLPRLIRAAKAKRQERRIRLYQFQVEPLYAEREAAHEALERARAKRFEVEEEIAAARQAWADPHGRLLSLERRIKDAERELSELRGEA